VARARGRGNLRRELPPTLRRAPAIVDTGAADIVAPISPPERIESASAPTRKTRAEARRPVATTRASEGASRFRGLLNPDDRCFWNCALLLLGELDVATPSSRATEDWRSSRIGAAIARCLRSMRPCCNASTRDGGRAAAFGTRIVVRRSA